MDRWELSWPWLLCAAACAWVRLKQSWGSNLSESGSERVVWNTGPIIGFTPQATQLGLHQLGSSKSTWSELLSCLHSSYYPCFHIALYASGSPGGEWQESSECHALFLLLKSLIGTKLAARDTSGLWFIWNEWEILGPKASSQDSGNSLSTYYCLRAHSAVKSVERCPLKIYIPGKKKPRRPITEQHGELSETSSLTGCISPRF